MYLTSGDDNLILLYDVDKRRCVGKGRISIQEGLAQAEKTAGEM